MDTLSDIIPAMERVEEVLKQVRAEIDAFYIELWHEHESRHPTHLFHYTSTEGLVGILSSQKFFLSDMLASSDRSEIRYGIELAIDVLQEKKVHVLCQALLESFQSGDLLLGLGDEYFIHAICFCPGRDVLTQWRAYSSAGGFAIGVDFKKLFKRAEEAEFAIARMLYQKDQQRDILRRTLTNSTTLFDRVMPMLREAPESEFKRGLDAFLLEVGILF